MGRTSKFSFPLPGRKSSSTSKEKEAPPKSSSGKSSSYQSKAQRFFGTDNELNIDSPARSDEHSWGYRSSSRSSGMSISISEPTHSTRSTNETESFSDSNADRWEYESGVFPPAHRVRGKASSTLLGRQYREDAGTDTSSSSRRMRHEGSDSTLKSYYDRQESPLSISQQTSASSARDLALRKGFPPVIHRSPLLQVDSIDPYHNHFVEHNNNAKAVTREKSMKKPSLLDLSTLFSRSKKNSGESNFLSPGSISTNASMAHGSSSGPRKLSKAPSRDLLKAQMHSMRSPQPINPTPERQASTSDTLYGTKKDRDYKISQAESRSANSIPRPTREAPSQAELSMAKATHLSPSNGQTFSWSHVRANITSPSREDSSAVSVSSHNTKTSRHTSASVFSNQDLKQSSVLSLSSDSEGELSDSEAPRTPAISYDEKASERGEIHKGLSRRVVEGRRQSTKQPEAAEPRKRGSRKGAAQTSPFISIPEGYLPSTRISGPWLPPTLDNHRQPSTKSRSADKEKRSSKKPPSLTSQKSGQHPTPPLSPNSVELHESKERSRRYMAVTQQEEALLEALRQKRARMREKIIQEHETAKSPPRLSDRKTSRFSGASSVSTLRGPEGSHGERILLYLDTPISDTDRIDNAEPSPDLSDFLTFGSDEDSTPRTSYVAPGKDKERPDSSIRKSERFSPATPPSAARLSAVGAHNLREARSESKKRANPGVRFVNERTLVNPTNSGDFLLDENESDVIWGM